MISTVWPGRRGPILLASCSSLFMAQLDATIVNVGLPSIGSALGGGIAGLQWVVDAYVLALGSLAISSGAAADRFGRRRVFLIGLVAFTGASVACSLAPTLAALIAARLLQGVAASMLMPSTLAIIAHAYPDAADRAAAVGIWAGVSGLSMVAGPLLGGALVSAVGWRALFWVNLPTGLLAIGLTARFVPESRADHPRALDLAGQGLLVMMLAPLAVTLIEAPRWGWTSPATLVAMVLTIAGAAGFAGVELRTTQPLFDLRLLPRPGLGGAIVFAMLAYAATFGFLFLNTLYLQQVRGLSPLHAGMALLPTTAAVVLTAPLAGRLTGHRGARVAIAAAGLLIAAAMTVLSTITPHTPYAELVAAYLLVGIGWRGINPPITTLAISALPAARAGMASAVAGSARQIGALLGVALMGSLVANHLGPSTRAGTAGNAFTDALHPGYLLAIGAGICITLLAASIRLPARVPATTS